MLSLEQGSLGMGRCSNNLAVGSKDCNLNEVVDHVAVRVDA